MKRKANGQERSEKKVRHDWFVPKSKIAINTINPIRNIVDRIKKPVGTEEKPIITLALGDPTVFGNLDTAESVNVAMSKALLSMRHNGYGPSMGILAARDAIAKRYSPKAYPVTADDVFIASGCSGAITLAIQALCNPGDNILIPKPGFSLYATVAGHSEMKWKYYNLLPDKAWEVDLDHCESLIDEKTRLIVINNPSNPAGSNYSRQHLLDILAFCSKFKLPILADEIYADMVFSDQKFIQMAELSQDVPIISVGGLAKQYSVPGWRVGWLIVHDRFGVFGKPVRESLISLSQLILGASTVIQAAIPDIFATTDQSFYDRYNKTLEAHAMFLVKRLSEIRGLKVVVPQGAMYFLVEIEISKFEDITDDEDFAQKLLTDELVFVLPGACFQAKNYFRVVTCAPQKMLSEACDRIQSFCERHYKKTYSLQKESSSVSVLTVTQSEEIVS
jgi:tyrosine aminotransferase